MLPSPPSSHCRQQQQQSFSFAISFLFSFFVVLSFSCDGRRKCFMSFCPTKHKTNQLARQPANQFSRSVQWKGEKTHWNVALLEMMMMMMMVKKKWKLFPLSLLSFFSVQVFLKKPLLATIFGYRLQEKEVTCSDLQLELKKKKKLKLKLKNSIEKKCWKR